MQGVKKFRKHGGQLKNRTSPAMAVFLFIVSLIQLFPLYWMFTFSLKDNKEIFGANPMGIPQRFMWDNYQKIFTKASMGTYLFNSVLITGVTIAATLLLAAMATYAIVRMKWKLSKLVYTVSGGHDAVCAGSDVTVICKSATDSVHALGFDLVLYCLCLSAGSAADDWRIGSFA